MYYVQVFNARKKREINEVAKRSRNVSSRYVLFYRLNKEQQCEFLQLLSPISPGAPALFIYEFILLPEVKVNKSSNCCIYLRSKNSTMLLLLAACVHYISLYTAVQTSSASQCPSGPTRRLLSGSWFESGVSNISNG